MSIRKIKRFVLCKLLNYHQVEVSKSDGVNEIGICKNCDRTCIKDSQGQWFLADGRTPR